MTFLLFATVMYFLPAIVAHNKRDFARIFLLNFFLGWTVIGWIAALIWACASDVHAPVMIIAGPAGGRFCCQCGAMAHPAARFCGICGRAV